MHRRPRPIAPFVLAALLAALLAACGGGTTAPDEEDRGPMDGDPEPYWSMTVTSGADEPFEVVGAAVAFESPNVIVLGDSTPEGWSVRFTVSGDVPVGFNGADEEDLLNATVAAPSGVDCIVTPTSTYAGLTFVTLAPPEDGVPVGIGNVTVDGGCGGFAEVTGFAVGFGPQ